MIRRRTLLAACPALVGTIAGFVGCQHHKEHRHCARPQCATCRAEQSLDARGRAYQEQSVHPTLVRPETPEPAPMDPAPVEATPEAAGIDPFDPRTSAAEPPAGGEIFGENLFAPAPQTASLLEPQPVSFQGGHSLPPVLDGTIEEHNPVQLGLPEAIEEAVPPGPVALEPIQPASIQSAQASTLEPALAEREAPARPRSRVERWPHLPLVGNGPTITPGPTAKR